MTPAPVTPTMTPQQVHHSWLQILLKILAVSAAVAPAAALPFADPATEKIIAQEAQLASGILSGVTEGQ